MSTLRNRNSQKDCKHEQQTQNSNDNKEHIKQENAPCIYEIIKGCIGMLTPTFGFIFTLYYTHD